MPSEDKLNTALHYVAAERDAFRSALAATLEQVRGIMAAGHNGDAHERPGAELGAFAAGRIRIDRFPDAGARDGKLKKSVLNSIRHAQQLLTATTSIGDPLHIVEVPDNGDLLAAVQDALATAGRAFAAARSGVAAEGARIDRAPDVDGGCRAQDRCLRDRRGKVHPAAARNLDLRVHRLERVGRGRRGR